MIAVKVLKKIQITFEFECFDVLALCVKIIESDDVSKFSVRNYEAKFRKMEEYLEAGEGELMCCPGIYYYGVWTPSPFTLSLPSSDGEEAPDVVGRGCPGPPIWLGNCQEVG